VGSLEILGVDTVLIEWIMPAAVCVRDKRTGWLRVCLAVSSVVGDAESGRVTSVSWEPVGQVGG